MRAATGNRIVRGLFVTSVLAMASCSRCDAEKGFGGKSGDRLDFTSPVYDSAAMEAYPAPAPVAAVPRSADLPRLEPAPAATAPESQGANDAVKLALLGLTRSRSMPGHTAPAGQEFVVLDTRWENIHPRKKMKRSELEADRTMGVAGFAGGSDPAGEEEIELDVAYRVPGMEEHALLLADGTAYSLDEATARLHGGAPYGRPFTLRTFGETADLRLAYLVPEGADHLALRFFDDTHGHIGLSVAGSENKAAGDGSPPAGALATGKAGRLDLAVLEMEDRTEHAGVPAPEGWRFVGIDVAATSQAKQGEIAAFVQLDPRKYAWIVTTGGHVRYASGASVGPHGFVRYPPGVYQRNEFVFLVPKDEAVSRLAIRDGADVGHVSLGAAPALPRAQVSARDGKVMGVDVLGVWRGEDEVVLDVVARNLVAGNGLEIELRQFQLMAEDEPLQPDGHRTATLVQRPPSPFLVPPGGSARFSISYTTAHVPKTLRVLGFEAEVDLALARVKETKAEPFRGDPSHQADDLIPPAHRVATVSDIDDPLASVLAGSDASSSSSVPPHQDREPNDRPERASTLGEDRNAKGSFEGDDTDHYRFTTTGAPALWTIEAEGKDVAVLWYLGTSPSYSNRQISTGEARVAIHDLLLPPGEHVVSVRGYAKSEAEPSSYALRLIPQGERPDGYEAEPNKDPARAHRFEVGQSRTGRIPPGDEGDAYQFSLATDERVAISLTSPPDGLAYFEFRGGIKSRGEPMRAGGHVRWEGTLPAGDYDLIVGARTPSLRTYDLRIDRLDPFTTAGDFEPNDGVESASELPGTLIASGDAAYPSDEDTFRLPVLDVDTDVTFTRDGAAEHLVIRTPKGGREHLENVEGDERRFRWRIPAGEPRFLQIRAGGPYSVRIAFDRGPTPRTEALLPVAIEFPPEHEPFAAWWHESQLREVPVTLANPGSAEQRVRLVARSSDPRWRVDLPREVTVPAGAKASVPLRVLVGADAASGRDVRIWVEAQSNAGRRVAAFGLAAECGASPTGTRRSWSVPASMIGGLDVASAAIGGRPIGDPAYPQRVAHLLSGLVTLDRNFYTDHSNLPVELTFDLAGEEAVPVAGFLLHPTGSDQYDSVGEFEVLLSLDGRNFTSNLSARMSSARVEQAFPLPEPVPARFARLRIKSARHWKSSHASLATFKVVASPGKGPAPAGGYNLAEPRLGGHIVWADGALTSPVSMLTEEVEATSFLTNPARPIRWVVGFHDERAARIRAVEWRHPSPDGKRPEMETVQVLVSTETPFGPWTPLANWKLERDPAGVSRLDLPEPAWARYVQFTSTDPTAAEYWNMPETVRLFEQPEDDRYRSVLGEWDQGSTMAIFEQMVAATPAADAAPSPSHATRDQAVPLAPDARHHDHVERGVDADWYRISVPPEHNTIRLAFDSDALSRLEWRLEGENGAPIRLFEEDETRGTVGLRAAVEPGKVYFLQVQEALRSIVFSWDPSGSVSDYHPQIYGAMARFASEVRPGHERVHLLPFGRKNPLRPDWGTDGHALQEAIAGYDGMDGSSDAEGALTAAARLLGEAKGSRAVMIVTDDDSGANWEKESELWRDLEDVRPRVFAVQIPVGSSPHLFLDRMQSWAAVDQGHYGAFRSRGDLDQAFGRATCLLRRPARYAVVAKTTAEEPPLPGRLEVKQKAPANDGTAFEIIFDASGSMHQKIGTSTKVQVARTVLRDLVNESIPAGTPVALRAFGNLQPRSCRTDLAIPLGPLDRKRMSETIRKIDPKDRSGTPLAASLRAVKDDLARAPKRKVVVLLTDGEESCGGDPGAEIRELKAKGFDVQVNIVGFGIASDTAKRRFERWAELGGGRYYDVTGADDLANAVQQALNPAFQALTPTGEILASGTVNGETVELPPGEYTVRVLGTPMREVQGVRVESAQVRELDLASR